MSVNQVSDISQLAVPDTPLRRDSPRLASAAREFEALLIGQMLRIARESGSGSWLGSGEDNSSTTALEFAEQQFASLLASNGGLGLAQVVSAGLKSDTGDQ